MKYQRTLMLILLVLVPVVMLTVVFTTLARAVPPNTISSPAAIISVDTTDDELNTDSDCSLREAIQAANTDSAVDACPAGSGADTVIVPAGTYTLTIPGADEDANASGDLDILDDLTLQGAGAISTTIDGGALDRVLHVLDSTVTVEGLTVSNGHLTSFDTLLGSGGGMLNQGGALTVANCVVRDNHATNGGGLSNTAGNGENTTLIVDHTQVLSNTTNGIGATGGGAGIDNQAYATSAQAVLTVSHSLVAGNQAIGLNLYQEATGGGIASSAHDCANCQATASILHSTIRDNQAAAGGGVVSGELDTIGSSSATLYIDSSTISGNTTTGTGFGMGTGGGLVSGGQTDILNSTISGNQALGTDDPVNGKGGGIWIGSNLWGQGTLTLSNSTVTGNQAVAAGGGIHSYPIAGLDPQLTIINSVVSGNSAPSGASCFNEGGTFTSQGYNLEDGDTCNFDQITDLVNTEPLLGSLQDNGGPTWTHALLQGSPAIDPIPVGANGCGSTLTTDQRGISRPQDGDGNGLALCDIGAFEKMTQYLAYFPIVMGPEE